MEELNYSIKNHFFINQKTAGGKNVRGFYFLSLKEKTEVETALQLIAFNIPFPADYGGVIDIFYKLKALSEVGISINLHCFEYNRPQTVALEKYCAKVSYYPRHKGVRWQFSTKPYIAVTRHNDQLIKNISENNSPILFEGLHSCYYLDHPALKNHLKLVRTHNIEHEYYHNLCRAEKNLFRKIFFSVEAAKLRAYEKILKNADHLLCISPNDNRYFDHKFGNSHFIPAFHPFDAISSKSGVGKYVLFHGNLSVAENSQAVDFLAGKVFGKLNIPVVVAGKNPSEKLTRKLTLLPNVRLIINPENEEMDRIIRDAHICILPTFQDTGLKLKLLASLFSGRFCVANDLMVAKTGLEHLCHIANSPEEMIETINELATKEFDGEEIEKRSLILEDTFSNHLNALKIKQLISK